MVTCSECGAENSDEARFCSECGASLYSTSNSVKRKEARDQCFGLPHGGTIWGIIFGLIIILWGLRELLGLRIDFGPFMIIIIGVLILGGAIYRYTRER